jgi:hypothetical protein
VRQRGPGGGAENGQREPRRCAPDLDGPSSWRTGSCKACKSVLPGENSERAEEVAA